MASLSATSTRIDPGTPRPSPLSANFGLRWDVDNWGDQEPDQERLVLFDGLRQPAHPPGSQDRTHTRGVRIKMVGLVVVGVT